MTAKKDPRIRRCTKCNAYLEQDGTTYRDLFGHTDCHTGQRHEPGSTG